MTTSLWQFWNGKCTKDEQATYTLGTSSQGNRGKVENFGRKSMRRVLLLALLALALPIAASASGIDHHQPVWHGFDFGSQWMAGRSAYPPSTSGIANDSFNGMTTTPWASQISVRQLLDWLLCSAARSRRAGRFSATGSSFTVGLAKVTAVEADTARSLFSPAASSAQLMDI